MRGVTAPGVVRQVGHQARTHWVGLQVAVLYRALIAPKNVLPNRHPIAGCLLHREFRKGLLAYYLPRGFYPAPRAPIFYRTPLIPRLFLTLRITIFVEAGLEAASSDGSTATTRNGTRLPSGLLTPRPHCKVVGRSFGTACTDLTTVAPSEERARRIFCSNRNARPGCGRTFSVWIAEMDKIRRLSLTTGTLWKFKRAVAGSIFGSHPRRQLPSE